MKKNIFLFVSFLINVFFLVMVGIYFFTSYLDYAVIQKSLPRMCRFIEATQPNFNSPLCDWKKSIKVVAPKEGDTWQQGQTYSVLWKDGADKVDLFLHDVALKSQGESVSIVDRVYGTQNNGNYEYQVSAEMKPGLYTWCISSNEDYVCSGAFSIVVASTEVSASSNDVSLTGDDQASSSEDVLQAEKTLRSFFDLLSTARYEAAVSLYGGNYEALRSWNPTLDPQNFSELWKNGCEQNGLQCMKVNNIVIMPSLTSPFFQFTVEFVNKDGDIYSDPKTGNTKFDYTVSRVGNEFVVMQGPPYNE